MSIQALRERKQALSREANAILAAAGDKVWSKEDQAKYDGLMDDLGRLNAQIDRVQAQLDADANNIVNQFPAKPGKTVELSILDACALFLRHGHNVTAEQAVAIRNAMSVGTPAEGGYTVATEVASKVVDAIKAYGGLREVATVIRSDAGNPWNYPSSDGTGETGEIVGENGAATGADITFGSVPLVVYKFGSKKIALPIELIQDSGINVVDFVIQRLATRIARRQNTAFTVGTGTGEPFGLVTRATSGKVGQTGQTATVIYDDIVDLIHSVNRGYRKNAVFSLADSSLKVLRKIKDTTGRPIFTPGYEAGITQGSPDMLLGYPIAINDDVPAMAANAKSIVFGDKTQYVVRDVMDVQIGRYEDSAFALNGQVGFCGWARSGGNLLDTAAVKFYQNSAT